VIEEWVGMLPLYARSRRFAEYRELKERIGSLVKRRRRLVEEGNDIPEEVSRQYRREMLETIEEGRILLGLDVLLRTSESGLADHLNTGAFALYERHRDLTATRSQPTQIKQRGSSSRHLVVEFQDCKLTTHDPLELNFFLYSPESDQVVSTSFQVKLSASLAIMDVTQIGRLQAIFANIASFDHLFLVCQLVRCCGLHEFGGKKGHVAASGARQFRRPFAVAVLPLEPSAFESTRAIMNVFAPTGAESTFGDLHKRLCEAHEQLTPGTQRLGTVSISLRAHHGTTRQLLAREPELCNSFLIHNMREVSPNTPRNDLYVTLSHGEYGQDTKKTSNLEVALSVRLDTGEVLPNCIQCGSEAQPEFRSMVFLHMALPTWKETIHVRVPAEEFSRVHLYFEVRHCSGKDQKVLPHAFGFLQLAQFDGTVLQNELHTVECYKPPREVQQGAAYLSARERTLRYRVCVHTLLTSTQVVQNVHLLYLLKWKKHQGELESVLSRFMYADPADIVSGLQNILPALFQILDEVPAQREAVFSALTLLFGHVSDKNSKFHPFHSDMDTFIANSFSSSSAYLLLPRSFCDAIKDVSNPTRACDALKALYYVVKFSLASCHAAAAAEAGPEAVAEAVAAESSPGALSESEAADAIAGETGDREARSRNWSLSNMSQTTPVAELKKLLLEIFGALRMLVQNPNPSLVAAHQHAVSNLADTVSLLQDIFTPVELGGCLCRLVNAIPSAPETPPALHTAKLLMMRRFLALPFYAHDPSVTQQVLSMVVRVLRSHLDRTLQETWDCTLVLGTLFDTAQTEMSEESRVLGLTEVLSLLPQLLKVRTKFLRRGAVHDVASFVGAAVVAGTRPANAPPTRTDELLMQLNVLLLQLFSLVDTTGFSEYICSPECMDRFVVERKGSNPSLLRSQSSRSGITRAVGRQASGPLLTMISSAASSYAVKCFPASWFAMVMFQHTALLRLARMMLPHLVEAVNGFEEHRELFAHFFALSFDFITHPSLALEHFSTTKQTTIVERYGSDMRLEMCSVLWQLWEAMGPHQSVFVKEFIGRVLRLLLVNQPGIQDTGIDMFISALKHQYQATGSFKAVRALTIDALDDIAAELADYAKEASGPADTSHLSALEGYLLSELESRILSNSLEISVGAAGTEFREQVAALIADLKELLQLLDHLQRFPDTPEWEDERVSATLKLMDYLEQTGQNKKYIRHVHALVAHHFQRSNWTQAGHTLLLHANLLPWEPRTDQFGSYSATRGSIYLKAIDYFDKGKAWETCIELIEELQYHYKARLFDYESLSKLLHREATFFDNIREQDRFVHLFALVGYYGQGFPSVLRGKEFIYRGYELERITAFTKRLQNKFPKAKMLRPTEAVTDEHILGDGQWISIKTIYPSSEMESQGQKRNFPPEMPEEVQRQVISNNVDVFCAQTTFRKSAVKSDNEFKDLWTLKQFYFTDRKLPGVLNRAEVIKKITVEESPLENAVAQLESKIQSVQQIIRLAEKNPEKKIQALSMALNGVIDAEVNGGVKKYREAFFNTAYTRANPSHVVLLEQMIVLVKSMAQVVNDGLALHAKHCPENMKQLQQKLERFFEKFKAEAESMALP